MTLDKNISTENKENINHISSSSSIQELLFEINGKGREEYPFLHPTYSPSSRIPCADFTSFIKRRLLENDIKSIIKLIQGVIEANPGLGIGVEWVEENIKNLLKLDFNKYINFANKEA